MTRKEYLTVSHTCAVEAVLFGQRPHERHSLACRRRALHCELSSHARGFASVRLFLFLVLVLVLFSCHFTLAGSRQCELSFGYGSAQAVIYGRGLRAEGWGLGAEGWG